jgi:radical SAM protein with 4Fe4S-binding SPASM domain
MFLDSVLSSFVYQTYSGCRSRSCEQKILTINADGTVGGCPNGAVEKTYGSISDDVASLLYSPNRLCNITSEASRNNPCSTCEVFDICNGDCYQLSWENDICAAPKSLMKDLKLNSQRDLGLYKEVLNGFMGQE